MKRDDFYRAYRAARWTLRNRPLQDLEIALPRDIVARRIIVAVLNMADKFAVLAG